MEKSKQVEKIFFWILLGSLLFGFFKLLIPFLSAILFAVVLALTFDPTYQWLLKLFRGRRHLAATFSLLSVIAFLAIPGAILGSIVTTQLLKLSHTLHIDPHFFQNIVAQFPWMHSLEQWLLSLGIEWNFTDWIKEMLENGAQYFYQFSPQVVTRTAKFFFSGLTALLLTYFLWVDGPKLFHEILDISPLKESHEKTLAHEIRITLRACIHGYLLTAAVQGILASIGFAIVGIQAALLLGVATFIVAFIPFFGTAAAWVPVFLYFLVIGHYGKATFLFVYGALIISGVDNILKPILIRGRTNIHPVLLFLSIFGGLKIWGPIGILAGPCLIAILIATLKIYRQDFR